MKNTPLIAGSTLAPLTGSAALTRLYKCPKCGHEMKLRDSDVWGKIVRCTACTARVANNFDMPQPPNVPRDLPRSG